MLERKSVAMVIILSIVTFGIYGLVWTYRTCRALQDQGQQRILDPVAILLLCLFLGSVGYIFVGICADDNLNAVRQQRGLIIRDNKVLYVLLGFFIPIVLIGLVQNDINELA